MCFQGLKSENLELVMLVLVPSIYQKHLIQFQIFESILLTWGDSEVVAIYSGKLIVTHLQ